MKNTIVFIFLLLSGSVFSQQNKWDVGIVGGPGISTMRWTKMKTYAPNPNFSFYAGFSARHNFNKRFAVHAEIAFDRKGFANQATLVNHSAEIYGTGNYINQMNYITLPLLFRVSTGKKVSLFIQAGAYVSYLLNETYKSSPKIDDPQSVFSVNTTADRPNMDFGISSGLGVAYPLKENFTISCELRGNYGLVNLNTYSYPDTKKYNESLNLLVGIAYKIGK